ncbi:hypothetical protein RFI_37719 [Reticulomyxa filosa]|uniref:Uncharacterized protein n=1 Tax=Reticulomyxa filosa TaxID=46433 RepID=X6LDW6_RETFI|nr:hypothetical protein RFI_37719 [Reticulomyxa filosa]|eukprot:ETN99748.1 hypothetical protein RFI_37719 [Reticulomyxa filosa]
MSQNDSEEIKKEKTVLKKCQKDSTESYSALIERILKKVCVCVFYILNCTCSAEEYKIFEDLKMPEIVSVTAVMDLLTKDLNRYSAQQKWDIICETTKKT